MPSGTHFASASVMGAVFTLGSRYIDIVTAEPENVATGMRTTFFVAATLMVLALAIAAGSRILTGPRSSLENSRY